MGRLLIAALGALALAGQAAAQSVDFSADLRAVAAQGLPSYLNGGLGELRFDPDHDGLVLGYLRAGFHDDLSDLVHINVQAFLYNTQDNNPIDLTEAYAELRPVPQSAWRSRLKLGAFYPGISLENRMSGWRSPYTLSPSAINTWVGEEVRTIGAEYNLDWLGLQTGHPFEFGATAALYGWNDAAGVVMASRGWAIDDRQTGLFGRVPVAGESNRLFYYHDIDKRAGYYVGLTGRYQDALEVRLLHYDNRANPNAENDSIDTYAWHTNFYSAGVRYTPQASWTFISQWMRGFTSVEDDDGISLDTWQFHAAFALASWQHGANRLSARYDRFTTSEPEYGGQDGHAWTFAYIYQFNERWNVALEALNIYTVNAARVLVDEPLAASERELQLAVRLEL